MKITDPLQAGREVDFFLRLHRHLPDDLCGGLPIGGCKYRKEIGEKGKESQDREENSQKTDEGEAFVKLGAKKE